MRYLQVAIRKANKPKATDETLDDTAPEVAAEAPVKSEKEHAKAEKNDAKAGKKQMELVAPTFEQRWNEIGAYRREVISFEEELIEAEQQVKEIKDEIKKRETKIINCLNMAAGIPVQQTIEVQESKSNDDKRFMDQSNVKTPEELRRHPQEAAEG